MEGESPLLVQLSIFLNLQELIGQKFAHFLQRQLSPTGKTLQSAVIACNYNVYSDRTLRLNRVPWNPNCTIKRM
jgi:hypothetical protein